MIKRSYIFAVLLIAVGFYIRYATAAGTFLHKDEVFDFETSSNYSFNDLFFYKYWDIFHPPLYFLFLKFWTLFDSGPLFLRIPSIIVSVFTLCMAFILGKLMLPKSKTFPFLMLAFFIFSQTQNSMGVMVRQYSFEIFFIILSLTAFYSILNGKKIPASLLVFINLLVFFGDYSGLWLIGSYFLYIIYAHFFLSGLKKTLLPIMFSLIISTGTFTVWAVFFLIKELPKAFSILHSGFFENSLFFLNTVIHSNSPFFTGTTFLPQWSALLLFLAFFGLLMFFYSDKERGSLPFFLFVFPLFTSIIFSVFFYKIFVNRNLIVINIAVIIGLAYIAEFLIGRKEILFRFLGIFFIVLWVVNFMDGFPKLYYTEQYNWINLIKVLQEKSGNDSRINIVTFQPKFLLKPLEYYGKIMNSKNIFIKQYRYIKKENFPTGDIFVLFLIKEYSPKDEQTTPETLDKFQFLYRCRLQDEEEIIPSVLARRCKRNNEL